MKLDLTQTLVSQMSIDKVPMVGVKYKDWPAASGPNYLVYDGHRDAPPGFAIRVGKRSSVYLVEKQVAGKNMKIPVGLAKGKKGDAVLIDLETARVLADGLIATAKKHRANPKSIADRIEASELTLGQVWDEYIKDLTGRSKPIKPNSLSSLKNARDKFQDWEDRKVRLVTGREVLDRFDLHAVTNGHKTAAEAMGRWATAAVNNAIENETHNAHSEGRTPSLTYNPFTILQTKKKYRDHDQLEKDYAKKGVRNPLSFATTVGPFIKAAWEYRESNPLAADYLLLDFLWGLRGDECRTMKWYDKLSHEETFTQRWVDMDQKVARVNDAKNRQDHEFPIGPFAYELLKLRREMQKPDDIWVFPARMPNSLTGHYSDPSVAMKTVRDAAGIKVVRGHDLRRTFGAACEKLGLIDRQVKRMLGHSTGGGDTLGRYTTPEWGDVVSRMEKIEEMIMRTAPQVFNALRPRGVKSMSDESDTLIKPGPIKKSRRAV
ncbi:tyrosine-type recombinase/integrase [Polaromonas sp. CG_9.11]|uniref:tyrosine-type recombinase/integrase n=1 Tax=Polaromonas sp. CG_9.11 TaxID=2787730 RepID=UPI0018CB2EB1|nr:tyrosine-type recombinase/integrase [Polaromonas sp. CG_9.11]MBG6075373.1 integrase [Polaromonas sp. CG_9.11]